jgi:hypothetical protein
MSELEPCDVLVDQCTLAPSISSGGQTDAMIRIIRGAEVDGPGGEAGGKRHGVFAYRADGGQYPRVCGYSRQPLLDACRQLKSLYGVTVQRVGLFRDGKDTPDISCPVEVVAAPTVQESRFAKYVDLSKVFPRGTGPDIFPEKPQPEHGALP